MKGFVKNGGNRPIFILQRAINPGTSISLEDAYIVVGKKSGKKQGVSFATWLRQGIFQDSIWEFYKEEGEAFFDEEPVRKAVKTTPGAGAGKNMVRRDDDKTKKGITALQIIDSDLVIAKQLIDKCKDKSVLRKALAATKHYSGKEGHMRYLLKRVEQVYF